MPKKKNPTDPFRLAREIVEAAIGEPLTPRRAKIRLEGKRRRKPKR